MYSLYIANKNYSSWSLRPWVLLKVLGVPFEEKMLPFGDQSLWTPFRAINPSGKVPCLLDGEITVWDSLAIVEYLAESHAGVWPEDRHQRAWARCATAEMHSGFSALRSICTMNVGLRVELSEVAPALRKDIDRVSQLWTEGLTRFGGPYLAGNRFTAVDAFFAPVVFRCQTYGIARDDLSRGYVERILALPAMQQWQAEALAETWRDESHEAEALAVGTVLADHRQPY
ncbi:MAG: glutathione S-transferase family protein [Marinobacter sp.]|uniref:glutathione S-transferase family protein n=1 Tax=Marinobacter sp. TaxID=50741 RepID=UPI00299CF538|nr:glutathione S-transferase family protein [Marinobacter sp.]MDX1635537.1 glutathione S-transferase family protein [Marinobacter sp.]